MPLQNAFELLAVESKQDDIITALAALLTELGQKLETGGEVSLSATSLAALESVTAAVSNFPADYPDTAVLAKVEAVRVLLAATLTVAGTVALDATTLAALETINAVVSGTVAVSNFPATQAVTATDLDVRNLVNATDSVQAIDAAETVGLTAVPFTITATGTTTLVAAPGGSSLLRLRRISPTFAIRSPDSEPILQLKVGAVEVQRGNALVGRFDVTAASSANAITLDVDVLDAAGRVTGTVYYEVV